MKIETKFCKACNKNTPHVEDIVFDKESATVWHCVICGTEQRPDGGNAMVLAQ